MNVIGGWFLIAVSFTFLIAFILQIIKYWVAPAWERDGFAPFFILLTPLVVSYMLGSFFLTGNLLKGISIILSSFADGIVEIRTLPLISIALWLLIADLLLSIMLLLAIWIIEMIDDNALSFSRIHIALPYSVYTFIGGIVIIVFGLLIKLFSMAVS